MPASPDSDDRERQNVEVELQQVGATCASLEGMLETAYLERWRIIQKAQGLGLRKAHMSRLLGLKSDSIHQIFRNPPKTKKEKAEE